MDARFISYHIHKTDFGKESGRIVVFHADRISWAMQTAADSQPPLATPPVVTTSDEGLRFPNDGALRAALLRGLLLTCAGLLWLLPVL